MAYMSQELKKELAPKIKQILKEYGVKATIGVQHHSGIVVSIRSSKHDFLQDYFEHMATIQKQHNEPAWEKPDYLEVNTYSINSHFSGKNAKFLSALHSAMNRGNHNDSDSQTDYFDIGWYTYITIGTYNKPYLQTG